ncbi:MAG TPA: hypothetical protein VN832_00245 [Stellaceae bacterium]|nr:hypothetical protein [Stellaceae bacterium]
MGYTLEQLSDACHRALKDHPGVEGRKRMCALVTDALKDEAFVKAHLDGDVPERKLLFEDAEFGFCILAHAYEGARESPPHDHGPSWAIYGQARGETIMSDFTLVEPPGEAQPGKVRFVKTYALKPGMAHLYNEGDLHAPRRDGPTRLLRIEGRNLEKIRRASYRLA